MLKRLEAALKIPTLAPAEEAAQRRRLQIIYICVGCATLFLIPFIPPEVRADRLLYWQTIAYYAVWFVYCLVGYVILRFTAAWVSALWLTIGMYGYISYALLLNGGLPNNFLTAYFLVILIFAALFLGRRATLFFIFLIGVSSVVVNFFSAPGWLMAVFAAEPTSLNLVSWIIFLGFFSFLLLSYLGSMEARQALIREGEEGYRLLFEVSPVALWEMDVSEVVAAVRRLRDGVPDLAEYFRGHPEEVAGCMALARVMSVNETAVSMFKAPDKASLLADPQSLLCADAQPLCIDSLMAMANGRASFERETHCRLFDGETMQAIYRWVVAPGHEQTYQHIITSVTNITPQKEAEAIQRQYVERLNIIHQIDIAILAADSMSDIASVTLRLLHELVPFTEAQVTLFDLAEGEVHYIADSSQSGLLDRRFPISFWDSVHELMRGAVFYYDDLQAEGELSLLIEHIRRAGGRSLFIVPLRAQGELVGAVGAISTEAGAFSAAHVEIVQQIAAPLAIAIQNARLFEAEKIARQRAERLRQVANILNANLDQDLLLDSILEQLAYVVPFDSATVSLKRDGVFQLVAHRGLREDVDRLITEHLPLFVYVNSILENGRPYIIADTRTAVDWIVLPGGEKILSWLGVPMLVRGEIIGLLMLDKFEPNFYKESDASLALVFANQAAIAIENATLYKQQLHYTDQLERRVIERMRDLNTLYDISALSSEPSEIEPVLVSALDTVLKALGCFAGAVHLLGEDGSFYLLHEIGVPAYVRPFIEHVTQDHMIVTSLLQPDAPATSVMDVAAAYGAHFLLPPGELTYAGALMRSKGNVMGVLSAVHNESQKFTAEDLALLAAIADHVAITVENGRLHENVRQLAIMQERERMARELHDSVTQSLYSLSLFAEAVRDLLGAGKTERVQAYLQQIVTTSLQALREMRLMLYDLRSTTLLEEGLVQALRYRLENVEERAGIETHLTAPENLILSAEVEESLYRISQEALNNTLKHARASRVEVAIQTDGPDLTMCLQDNGRGFPVENWPHITGGQGLLTIQKQVAQLGGLFTLESQPEQGTIVTVRLNGKVQAAKLRTNNVEAD